MVVAFTLPVNQPQVLPPGSIENPRFRKIIFIIQMLVRMARAAKGNTLVLVPR
jgi:hypothetical protein